MVSSVCNTLLCSEPIDTYANDGLIWACVDKATEGRTPVFLLSLQC